MNDRVPCCERGGPSSPKEVQGGLSGSPRIRAGTSRRQRSHDRHPPLGQPQLNVPRERATRVGSPYRPDFPKSTIARGPRTTHYAAQGRRANIVFSLEREREEEKRWVLVATSAPLAPPAFDTKRPGHSRAFRFCMYMCIDMYMFLVRGLLY